MKRNRQPTETERRLAAAKRLILSTPNWHYYVHELVRDSLNAAGFHVRWVERLPFHPVFNANLRRGTFPLSGDNREAARQLRQLLAQAGIVVGRDELSLTQNRYGLCLSFLYPCLEVGVFLDCETGRTGPGWYIQDEWEVFEDYAPQM